VSNVLNEQKKQQVIALGRLGWSLRRIQRNTGVRRETVAAYLREAGVAVRSPGLWGVVRNAHRCWWPGHLRPKPANEVTTDFGVSWPHRRVPAKPIRMPMGSPARRQPTCHRGRRRPGRRKPAIAVTTDFGVAPDEKAAPPPASASGLAPCIGTPSNWGSRGAATPWRSGRTGRRPRLHRRLSERQALRAQAARQPVQASLRGIETAPGEEAQVDYGTGPMARDPHSGKYRRICACSC